MKKPRQLSTKIVRQLEILTKYYDINFETRTITLELYYEKVSDLFDDNVVTTKRPKFKYEVLQRVSQVLDTFPLEFKVDLKFKIDDYEGLDSKDLLDSFKDALEMFHYSMHREKSGRLLTAVVLALVSVAILFFRQFALKNEIITDEYLTSEMLDIVAWVFLWQAVTVLFLTPNELREISFKILTRLNVISLYEKDNLLRTVSQDELKQHWVQITKAERASKKFLIVVGAFSLATGVMNIINSIQAFITVEEFSWISLVALLFMVIIQGTVSVLGGIGAISLYRDKGPFQKIVALCAYLYLVIDIIIIAFYIIIATGGGFNVKQFLSSIVSNILLFVVSILYFVSYIILRRVRKMNSIKSVDHLSQ